MRPYFYRQGCGGRVPLDAELSLGSDQYSGLLGDMAEHLGVFIAYNKSAKILERFFKQERELTAPKSADKRPKPQNKHI